MNVFHRKFEIVLSNRLREKNPFIQVILGPRQVGKTTGVLSVLKDKKFKKHSFFSCEEAILDSDWFLKQVQLSMEKNDDVIVFDEIQKLENWSELVKLAWDRQKNQGKLQKWVLLGSSSLKISIGLNESLAGRYEVIPVYHWNSEESHQAFKLSFEDFICFGGYPGSYQLLNDQKRWNDYLLNSIFESVVTKDILRFVTIKKPALFRQLFLSVSQFPACEVSYNKLLGQLQDAVNVDQVKHYLDLFEQAFLIKLIFNWKSASQTRTSSPKIILGANAFTSLFGNTNLSSELKGRLFENSVGNILLQNFSKVYYWREGQYEVDFVIEIRGQIIAVEVKSNRRKPASLQQFKKKYTQAQSCFVTQDNFEKFQKDPIFFIHKFAI
jgi:predicted AAA+ superfamily ATPase